jgi:mono/diheme cytochrome c family protein
MRTLLRRLSLGLTTLLGLALILFGVVWGVSAHREARVYEVPVRSVIIPTDAASIAEGERLYTIRGCAECHGADAGGKVLMDIPPALVAPSNLTVMRGRYDDAQLVRAIRHGLRPDGTPLIFMPSGDYTQLSDADVSRIVAWLRQAPDVQRAVPTSEIQPLGRMLHVFQLMDLLPAEHIDHTRAPESPAAEENVEFGRYLAQTCTGCHGANFSGGPIPGAPVEQMGMPQNLTPDETGLAGWTRADLVKLLRTGERPDGSRVDGNKMPYHVFREMTDTELGAIQLFLAQLPPRPFGGR